MTIEYSEITPDGEIVTLSEEELVKRTRDAFFSWLFEVGKLANWTDDEKASKVSDPSWFFCFDDGLKPEAALAEARSKGVV